MSHTPWILAPRDGFFAKDGRGWYTSASGRARGLRWPWPTTIRGAVRAAWGRQLEDTASAPLDRTGWLQQTAGVELGVSVPVLGPAGRWTMADRLWPVPADAFYAADVPEIVRLRPQPPSPTVTVRRFGPGAAQTDRLWRPALPTGKPTPRPQWWPEADFAAWLAGRPVWRHGPDARGVLDPPRRTDIRLKIDPRTGTAADGFLFSTELTETDAHDGRSWAVAVDVATPTNSSATLDGALTYLGGKRRLARLEAGPPDVFAPPPQRDPADAAGLRLYVVTPAHFAAGWLPTGFARAGTTIRGRLPGIGGELHLRAALVGRPVAVGGWDLYHNRPKPIRRLVAAGSVYFFERVDGSPITGAERDSLWLSALPQATPDDIADGLGRVVAAPWNPTETP